jgi:hypothetical protein
VLILNGLGGNAKPEAMKQGSKEVRKSERGLFAMVCGGAEKPEAMKQGSKEVTKSERK